MRKILIAVPLMLLVGILSACATATAADPQMLATTRIKVTNQKDGTIRYVDRTQAERVDTEKPWWQKYPRFPGTHP